MSGENADHADPDESQADAGTSWLGLALAAIGLAAGAAISVLLVVQFMHDRPLDFYAPTQGAAALLEETLMANRVPSGNIVQTLAEPYKTAGAHGYIYEYDILLPAGLSLHGMENIIEKAMRKRMILVSDLMEDGQKAGLQLAIGDYAFASIRIASSRPPDSLPALEQAPEMEPPQSAEPESETPVVKTASAVPEVQPGWQAPPKMAAAIPSPSRGKLALIIDDGGYGGEVTEAILALSPALTVSILPYTPHGAETARRAQELGFEILLHMPMENVDNVQGHEGLLSVGQSEEEIRSLTEKALAQVPGALGVNNHMGSRFTADPRAMALFLGAVQELGLFFVDSVTTRDSKAFGVAEAFGIPAARNDLFLDHDGDPEDITRQFNLAVKRAKERGSAIAICHFRPSTAQVLARLLPTLEEHGVELVHVSELVQ